MSEVARRAGVSPGTVSHVLNHPSRVTPATRERVERAMAELGYRPNRIASSLAAGRSRVLGLVLTDLGNSLFVDIARGAGAAAAAAGMNVILADGDNHVGRELEHLEMFSELRVAGALITLSDDEHMAAITQAAPRETPLVLVNFTAPTDRYCSVAVDNVLGARLATEHLLSTGRRRLAFVGGPDELRPIHDRRAGFRAVLAAAGLEPVLEVDPPAVNRSDGFEAAGALLAAIRAGRIDGVVAATDLLAAGLIQALAEADVDVPGTVAVTGYDDNQAAWDGPVPLTTIAQPGEDMGRLATELAVEEARAPERAAAGGGEHEARAVVLEPRLVVRASAP
ncbi:MAG TPA: LacI family transcriptional regulator [Micrococcales bacterium]|nr:LacI family transcriptional regulator [Micrococcales bacterium]